MRRRKQWIGFLVMVLGAALLLGPFVQGDIETRRQNDYVAELRAQMNQTPAASAVPVVTASPRAVSTPVVTDVPAAATAAVTTNAPTVTDVPAATTAVVTTNAPIVTDGPAAATVAVINAAPAVTDGPAGATVAVINAAPAVTDVPAVATATVITDAPSVTEPVTVPPTNTEAVSVSEQPDESAQPAETPTAAPTAEPQDPFFQEALAYNRKLVEQGQNAMNTIDDLQKFEVDATKYGYRDNVVGTISIPRLSVEVPLYLGATNEHMATGFAVFGMTSMPLGLGVENVAIAGHRGWRGAAMLRDVQMLMPGDPIHITTPWANLTYLVSGIEIVMPNNVNWCKLKPGKTMISLMTCHPYGKHSQRYIVYAELKTDEDRPLAPVIPWGGSAIEAGVMQVLTWLGSAAMPTAAPTPKPTPDSTPAPTAAASPVITAAMIRSKTPTPDAPTVTDVPTATVAPNETPTATVCETSVPAGPASTGGPGAVIRWGSTTPEPKQTGTTQEITFVHDDGTRETILIDTAAVEPDEREFSTEWSNTLILAENNMRPVAYVTAGIVAAVGLWLIIVTIRDAKQNKRGKHDDEE